MTWKDEMPSMLEKHGKHWTKIAEELSQRYGFVSSESVRIFYRRHIKHEPRSDQKYDLLTLLKNPISLETLSAKLNKGKKEIRAEIKDYQQHGYNIANFEGNYTLCKETDQSKNIFRREWHGEDLIIGIMSDTHLCSKSAQITYLHDFYDKCQEYGVKDVYHCGDIIDGINVYAGQEYSVHTIGIDEQKDFCVKNYPYRKGITTHVIAGNHDTKVGARTGYDVVRAIAYERDDLDYLGQYYARVNLTPKCILQMTHPMGNLPYAVTYKIQREMDGMTGGDKPHILAEGHLHVGAYLFKRNIHGLMCPSFQGHRFVKTVGFGKHSRRNNLFY